MTRLEELNLSNAALTSLEGSYPPNLTVRTLPRMLNYLSADVGTPVVLRQVLRVNGNAIADLKALPTLPKLTELYARATGLAAIATIAVRLPQLETLDVRDNKLLSVEQLEPLKECAALDDLWVDGNPCSVSNRYHPSLSYADAARDVIAIVF